MSNAKRIGYTYADLHVGMSFRSPGRTITDADLVAFAGLTGDYSELHTSEVYARASQFSRRVAPSYWAQRRVPHGFNETPLPFQKRHLDDLASAGIEFESPMLGFLPRCHTCSLTQTFAPKIMNHCALGALRRPAATSKWEVRTAARGAS